MRVDATDARAAVRALVAAGVGFRSIAEACGVGVGVIANLAHASTGVRLVDVDVAEVVCGLTPDDFGAGAAGGGPVLGPRPVGCPRCGGDLTEVDPPGFLGETSVVRRSAGECGPCGRAWVVTVTLVPFPSAGALRRRGGL